jgi:hypothetical protein
MEFIQEFKKDDWTKRLSKAQYLRGKHPDRILVIVDRIDTKTPKLKENRFLVPPEMTRIEKGVKITEPTSVGHLMHILRRYIPSLSPDKALFLSVCDKNILPPIQSSLAQIYTEHHDRDGFLYMTVMMESTFG